MPEAVTLFHEAASKGDIPALKKALQDGIDINAINRQQRTAILIAAMNKQYDTVQFLIDAGADINFQDETCFTCIWEQTASTTYGHLMVLAAFWNVPV